MENELVLKMRESGLRGSLLGARLTAAPKWVVQASIGYEGSGGRVVITGLRSVELTEADGVHSYGSAETAAIRLLLGSGEVLVTEGVRRVWRDTWCRINRIDTPR